MNTHTCLWCQKKVANATSHLNSSGAYTCNKAKPKSATDITPEQSQKQISDLKNQNASLQTEYNKIRSDWNRIDQIEQKIKNNTAQICSLSGDHDWRHCNTTPNTCAFGYCCSYECTKCKAKKSCGCHCSGRRR